MAAAGKTIFLTTHNMVEAEQLCQRVAVVQHGRLVVDGDPHALVAGRGHEITIVGAHLDSVVANLDTDDRVLAHRLDGDRLWLRLSTPDPSDLVATFVGAGVLICEIVHESSLEDIFVELMRPDRAT